MIPSAAPGSSGPTPTAAPQGGRAPGTRLPPGRYQTTIAYGGCLGSLGCMATGGAWLGVMTVLGGIYSLFDRTSHATAPPELILPALAGSVILGFLARILYRMDLGPFTAESCPDADELVIIGPHGTLRVPRASSILATRVLATVSRETTTRYVKGKAKRETHDVHRSHLELRRSGQDQAERLDELAYLSESEKRQVAAWLGALLGQSDPID